MFEYLKNKILNNGILVLQETHSSENSYNEWHDEIKGELYFAHGTTNSCGVMIGFITTKKFSVSKTSKNSEGRILIVEVIIEEVPFILVSLYNANTKVEQLKTLCELDLLFYDFLLDDTKNIIFVGDLNLFFLSNLEPSGDSPTLNKKSTSKILQFTGKYNMENKKPDI